MAAFNENPVQLWEKALKWEYRYGSALENYYEKQQLLALAEPNLPTRSFIALIIKGLPGEHQKQRRMPAAHRSFHSEGTRDNIHIIGKVYRVEQLCPLSQSDSRTTGGARGRQIRKFFLRIFLFLWCPYSKPTLRNRLVKVPNQ